MEIVMKNMGPGKYGFAKTQVLIFYHLKTGAVYTSTVLM